MKFIVTIFTFVFAISTFAGPGTYYNSLDTTKSCATFKTALFRLIENSTSIAYSQVDNHFNQTDLKPSEIGGGDAIVDRYCTENPNGTDYCVFRYPAGFCLTTPSDTNQCNCYNKEHVFPKSWFGLTYPAYSDIHFVWPCDAQTNFKKGNYPLGYTQRPASFTSKNGSTEGLSDGTKNFGYTSSHVFEPIDSFKGDFARAYLYVVTRYQDSLSSWQGRSIADYVLSGNTYPGFDAWILKLCVKWSKMDPPGAFEMKRNDSVYAIQGNRNPYIDHPEWVEKVFGPDGNSGSCVATAVKQIKQSAFSVFPNPATGFIQLQLKNFLTEAAELDIVDALGRKWKTDIVQPDNTLQQIDISSLPKGTYWLQLKYKADVSTLPFIVQ